MKKNKADNKEAIESKNKKDEEIDYEFTVTDMSADWMPWNRGIRRRGKKLKENSPSGGKKQKKYTDKQEYRRLVLAQYAAMLPAVLCIIAAFAVVAILAILWLR